jgi:hypothetical protein
MQEIHSGIYFPRPGLGWLAAPAERSPEFFPTFARVSAAVQTILRERIPAQYFENTRTFANVKTAYPMLVYQASRPFRGKMRTELSYDVLNPTTLAAFFRTVRPVFGGVLEAVKIRLQSEGLNELAALYEAGRASAILQSVQKWSKEPQVPLRADPRRRGAGEHADRTRWTRKPHGEAASAACGVVPKEVAISASPDVSEDGLHVACFRTFGCGHAGTVGAARTACSRARLRFRSYRDGMRGPISRRDALSSQ